MSDDDEHWEGINYFIKNINHHFQKMTNLNSLLSFIRAKVKVQASQLNNYKSTSIYFNDIVVDFAENNPTHNDNNNNNNKSKSNKKSSKYLIRVPNRKDLAIKKLRFRNCNKDEYIVDHLKSNLMEYDHQKIEQLCNEYICKNIPSGEDRISILNHLSTGITTINIKAFLIIYGDSNTCKSSLLFFLRYIAGALFVIGHNSILTDANPDKAFSNAIGKGSIVLFDEAPTNKKLNAEWVRKKTCVFI